jgi:hypothetical protein
VVPAGFAGAATLTVTDARGGADSLAVPVVAVDPALLNRPPVARAGADQAVVEGATVRLDGLASADPDGDALAYGWALLSGTGAAVALSSPTAARPTFLAPDDGRYTFRLTVADGKGGTSADDVTVTVHNAPPAITAVTGPTAPLPVGTAAGMGVTFTDPGRSDTHACTFAWGDGQPSTTVAAAAATGGGTCQATHPYAEAGVHTLGVTVVDDDGGRAGAAYEFVVVYDPSAGFVTGGGWIASPAGACKLGADCQAATGRADFGFVSRYRAGAAVPTGQTQFQFRAGTLTFHSGAYEWLVVAGARAQLKGTGTVNGGGTYGFLLTAVDGQVAGGGGMDRFRIKIWDKATGAIVYDNQMGANDGADTTTTLGGGSITIHG